MPAKRSEEIRADIIKEIFHTDTVNTKKLSEKFHVSVQSIYKQISMLENANAIKSVKSGRNNMYFLVNTNRIDSVYNTSDLSEDEVLTRDFAGIMEHVPDNARRVFAYVFTEMLNNAIEHSESQEVFVTATKNQYALGCTIADNGVGIFSKIQKALGLAEKRYAILELAKGKFTTDPESHTGEGIFFSSKAADKFIILSDELAFIGDNLTDDERPVLFDRPEELGTKGTTVMFDVALNKETPISEIFNKYTQHPDDYGFTKTIIPVRLLEYQEANPVFVSRSQAKRLLVRFERFENIVLDFKDVAEIGQGFADEIFRIFRKQHPECKIMTVNTNPKVEAMIRHVENAK